jgi:acid phosphatase family membrane protein YuiD
MNNLFDNPSFVSAFFGWLTAQTIKFTWNLITTHKLDFSYIISTGGMPSAHCAAVSALAASVGIIEGVSSSLFAVALAFALIVMFDAQSVRRAAGQQARILNKIVEELFKEHHLSKQKLAELLGHTRLEVLAGTVLGISIAFAVHHWW